MCTTLAFSGLRTPLCPSCTQEHTRPSVAPGISERLPPGWLGPGSGAVTWTSDAPAPEGGRSGLQPPGQWDLEPLTGQTRWPPLAQVEKSFSVSTPFEPCVSTVLSFWVPLFYLTWINAWVGERQSGCRGGGPEWTTLRGWGEPGLSLAPPSLPSPSTQTLYLIECPKSLQLCLTLCDPMDCSLPGSSVHGNSPGQNTGEGKKPFPSPGESSQPRSWTRVSCIAGGFFTSWDPRETLT